MTTNLCRFKPLHIGIFCFLELSAFLVSVVMSPHIKHTAPITAQSKYLINMCVGSHPDRFTVLLTCMTKLHSVRLARECTTAAAWPLGPGQNPPVRGGPRRGEHSMWWTQ